MNIENSNLYGYLFHFNHHTNRWAAFKREDKDIYFNNMRVDSGKVIYSNKIEDLISYLNGIQGRVNTIK